MMTSNIRVAFSSLVLGSSALAASPSSVKLPLAKVETQEAHPSLQQGPGEQYLLQNVEGRVLAVHEHELTVEKKSHQYQAPIYLGSSRMVANVGFDTGSSYVVTTSDLCSNCHSKAYIPGDSKTTQNEVQNWQLDFEQPGKKLLLKCETFTDTVCITNEGTDDDLCVDDFQFYPIFEQKNMRKDTDGLLGIAPLPTNRNSNEGPSFINALYEAELIKHNVVSLFISRFKSKDHSIQIGDYDDAYVEGGETGLHWFSLNIDAGWQTDLTDAYFGGHLLFKHDFKWVEFNAGFPGAGLTSEDFDTAAELLKATDSSIFCDENRCLGEKSCDYYADKVPDFTLTVSNRVNFTLAGSELLKEQSIVDHTGDYLCKFLIYNSGDFYRMGDTFLKNHYSVYDLKNYKIAIGKVFDFEAPPPSEEKPAADADADGANSAPEDSLNPTGRKNKDSQGGEDDETWRQHIIIFACMATFFMIISCCVCKKLGMFSPQPTKVNLSRTDAKARGHRKYPIRESFTSEGDPNEQLTAANLSHDESGVADGEQPSAALSQTDIIEEESSSAVSHE